MEHNIQNFEIHNIYNTMFPCLPGAVGLSFLQFTNMNSMRNLIITGLTLFLGISVPQFFNEFWTSSHHGPVHTNAGWVCFPYNCPIIRDIIFFYFKNHYS
jgi:hypothetical protein